jgi:hypothetical protein
VAALGIHIGVESLAALVNVFLTEQESVLPHAPEQNNPNVFAPAQSVWVYASAVATFRAPGDWSGVQGMKRERIRATRTWRGKGGRYDTVFLNGDETQQGMRGLLVARVLQFMRITTTRGDHHPCALVHWWSVMGTEPDDDTGMWMAEPDLDADNEPILGIVHLDTIVRAAHLLPVFGDKWIPHKFSHTDTLDSFESYYVNKFVDHHAFSIAF